MTHEKKISAWRLDRLLLVFLFSLSLAPFQIFAGCHEIKINAIGADNVRDVEQVSVSRLYLYTAPSARCRTVVFIVKEDAVEIYRDAPEFLDDYTVDNGHSYRYISFRNSEGRFATGWVKAARLRL